MRSTFTSVIVGVKLSMTISNKVASVVFSSMGELVSKIWINVAFDTISSVYVGSAVGLCVGCEDGCIDNDGVEDGVPVGDAEGIMVTVGFDEGA